MSNFCITLKKKGIHLGMSNDSLQFMLPSKGLTDGFEALKFIYQEMDRIVNELKTGATSLFIPFFCKGADCEKFRVMDIPTHDVDKRICAAGCDITGTKWARLDGMKCCAKREIREVGRY